MDDLIHAGKIGKPHGIKGEITLHFYVDADVENIPSIFIEIDHNTVPYIVEYIYLLSNNKVIVKLKSISNIDAAKKLTNKTFYIEKKYIIQNAQQAWIGFSVIDVNKNKEIGKIADWIVQNQLEWMIVHTQDNREIILPFNNELIEKIDETHQVIFYKAIEGMY